MPPRRLVVLALLLSATSLRAETFGADVAFLKKHTTVVVLGDSKTGPQVAVAPDLQGRVMTSSAQGVAGQSFGWINRALLASKKRDPHFNPYGGEDRFWLGPEAGQFGLFFKKGDPFDLAHWYTPPSVDTELWMVVSESGDRIAFRKDFALENASGTQFVARVERSVGLVTAADAWRGLQLAAPPGVSMVAYESENKLTNTGTQPWTKEGGLLSIWILGMFEPSPATTVVIPFKRGPESRLGPVVNDAYFGKVPEDRIVVRADVLFFKADGAWRSKIGIPPSRALSTLGSYDASGRVLTLVQYTRRAGAADYVNSMWEEQKAPFVGDVVNSYNDGPPAPNTKSLGPFYELETSSPAAALTPKASLVHRHRTLHIVGERASLDAVARKALGVGLDAIEAAVGGGAK